MNFCPDDETKKGNIKSSSEINDELDQLKAENNNDNNEASDDNIVKYRQK